MSHIMKRSDYADMFGPTTGDKVRLGDTGLVLEVERDHTVYGDECKFGGGKVIREGMGQAAGIGDQDALDAVVTNALIIDYSGIYKADIGIKAGLIAGIGKAGNPDVMAGVSKGMSIGVTTEVLAGEGLLASRPLSGSAPDTRRCCLLAPPTSPLGPRHPACASRLQPRSARRAGTSRPYTG